MPKSVVSREDQVLMLLRQLVAIELWRGGLSQDQISRRLGVRKAAVNEILKGVSRKMQVASPDEA
jgi:predicted transcriptional regulator